MSLFPEQFSAARKTHVAAQFDFFRNVSNKAVESAEQIVALNLSTSRASLEKSTAVLRELMTAKDPRDLFALTKQSQNNMDSLLAYGRALFSIAAGARIDLSNAVASAPALQLAGEATRAAVEAVADQVADGVADQLAAAAATKVAFDAANDAAAKIAAEVAAKAASEVEAEVAFFAGAAAKATEPVEPAPVSAKPAETPLADEPAAQVQVAPLAPVAALVEAAVEAVTTPDPFAEAKPIAKAVGKLAAQSAPVHPDAAPVPDPQRPVQVTGIKPVDAKEPVAAPSKMDAAPGKSTRKK